MKIAKITSTIFIIMLVAFYYNGGFDVNKTEDKKCSEETMNLVDYIHVGMSADESIKILQDNGISYSIWKGEIEVKMDSAKALPLLFEIAGVAKKNELSSSVEKS